jgi:hypothetical protein
MKAAEVGITAAPTTPAGPAAIETAPLRQRSVAIRDCLIESKRAFAFYDAVVGRANSEDILLEAQDLSTSALARLQAVSDL